jgi:predicted nucleic acid-binding protein
VVSYYFDSSGLVKRYVAEVGSNWVISLTDPAAGNRIYVANITGVEVTAAINKRVRMGDINPADATTAITNFQNDLANQYNALLVTDQILTNATALTNNYKLRAYDAVQLAVALELNQQILGLGLPVAGVLSLTLISADNDLNIAALAEGLAVDNPRNHP